MEEMEDEELAWALRASLAAESQQNSANTGHANNNNIETAAYVQDDDVMATIIESLRMQDEEEAANKRREEQAISEAVNLSIKETFDVLAAISDSTPNSPMQLDQQIRDLQRTDMDRYSDYNALIRQARKNDSTAKYFLYKLQFDAFEDKRLLPEDVPCMEIEKIVSELAKLRFCEIRVEVDINSILVHFFYNLANSIHNKNATHRSVHPFAQYRNLCDQLVDLNINKLAALIETGISLIRNSADSNFYGKILIRELIRIEIIQNNTK